MTARTLVAAVMGLALGAGVAAQDAVPTFEAASVKRSPPGNTRASSTYKGVQFTYANTPLLDIIKYAYGVGPYYARPFASIENAPRWLSDRFDIVATTGIPVAIGRMDASGPIQAMLRQLLADRFTLKAHWATKEGPVHALVRVTDRFPGAGLTPSTVNCDEYRAQLKASPPPRPVFGAPIPPPVCGIAGGPVSRDGRSLPNTNRIQLGTEPMKSLVDALGRQLGEPVIDRTQLAGRYNVELRYSIPPVAGASPAGVDQADLLSAGTDPGAALPRLPEALRDQLGLRLERQQGLVDVLVIDSVEPPAPD